MSQTLPQPPVSSPRPRRIPWRGSVVWGLLILLGLGAAWVFAGGWGEDRRESLPDAEPGLAADSSAVVVTVEPVAVRELQRTVEVVGTLHGFEEVTLSAKVDGRVVKLHHDVADRVPPGELLLEIDPTDYELGVQQAEKALQVELARLGLQEPPGPHFDLGKVPTVVQAQARTEFAKARLERVRRLTATRAASAEDLDTMISEAQSTQAEFANQLLLARAGLATIQMKQTALAVAQQQRQDTRLSVPTPTRPVPGAEEGVTYAVIQRSVAEGSFVRMGTEVCKLVIDQTLKLRAPVPERYSRDVRVGQKVEVRTAAYTVPFFGTVTRINPAVEPTTRTFEVEIQVPNQSGELKPGSFAKAAIHTRRDAEAVTVPLAAVVQFAGITKIFLADQGAARAVPVTLGVQTTEWVEVAQPTLPRGAKVITSGHSVLASDTPIVIR